MLFRIQNIILIVVLLIVSAKAQENSTVYPRENSEFFDPENPANIPNNNANSTHPLGLIPNPIIRTDTKYTYEDLVWRSIDTSLLHFHEYNTVSKWNYPHLFLGIVGQNYRSLVYDPNRKIGFLSGYDSFEKYWYTSENIKYYNTKIPFTSLYYNLGANAENNANATHSQNVGPNYNFAFDYKLTNAKGAFINQKTLMHNLNLNNWYYSKNHRAILLFAFLFNRLNLQENGGLNFEDLYTKENSGTDRSLVPVHLDDAVNDINNKGIYLKQIYFLGSKDSMQINDTTTIAVVQRKYAISYAFNLDSWKYKYTDEESDTNYYQNLFLDSTGTADSSRFWTVKHIIKFENTPETWLADSVKVMSKIRYFGAIEYAFTKYHNLDIDRKLNNLYFSGGIASNSLDKEKLQYGVNGKLALSPKSIGDFVIDGFLRWQINEMMHLTTRIESNRSSPREKEREYKSNHFIWENNFKPVFDNRISLIFRCDHGDIDGELTLHNVQRFIYFDEKSNLIQAHNNLNVLIFRGSKAFTWKNFYLYNGITAQYISDKNQLHLPNFIFKQSFHYHGGFFKGLLTAHLGFDINYYTNYYADRYNPSLAEFYWQETDKLKFYPVVDVFFEIFIKRARLFFLMQHVNQGMFAQKGYYVAPDYGAQDRAFKLGVSWQFYD